MVPHRPDHLDQGGVLLSFPNTIGVLKVSIFIDGLDGVSVFEDWEAHLAILILWESAPSGWIRWGCEEEWWVICGV